MPKRAEGAVPAGRLLDAGLPVLVWNLTAQRCQPLPARGAKPAATPCELAAERDVVLAWLSDALALAAALADPDGVGGQGSYEPGEQALESVELVQLVGRTLLTTGQVPQVEVRAALDGGPGGRRLAVTAGPPAPNAARARPWERPGHQ